MFGVLKFGRWRQQFLDIRIGRGGDEGLKEKPSGPKITFDAPPPHEGRGLKGRG